MTPNTIVSTYFAAGVLGLTVRRVQQLVQAGYIPKARHGRVPLDGAVQGYVRLLRERRPRGDDFADIELDEALAGVSLQAL